VIEPREGDVQVAPAVLRLYVAGESPRSRAAVLALRALCDRAFAGRVVIEVVDVLHEPARARLAGVFAVPTVVRERPLPMRRVVGDLSDAARVLAALELGSAP
jgi:circadian clock protein KaiB